MHNTQLETAAIDCAKIGDFFIKFRKSSGIDGTRTFLGTKQYWKGRFVNQIQFNETFILFCDCHPYGDDGYKQEEINNHQHNKIRSNFNVNIAFYISGRYLIGLSSNAIYNTNLFKLIR